MKRLLILTLTLMVTGIMTAGNVTPEEAQQKAERFLQSRSGKQRAPGTSAPRLTMTRQVCGLYVFNVSNQGGFVIVSPDDRAEEILGYSDSGSFDPDNIPCNMHAWLQGYADEIAWLQKQPNTINNVQRTAKVSRRAARRSVGPLIQTHWTQSGTFADKCIFNGIPTVTGCVATAMAQVMYYHQWPNVTIDRIPAYKTKTQGFDVAAIPNGTIIDWNNILPEYEPYFEEGQQYTTSPPNSTAEQKNAVAELLYYCGASVTMDYGPDGSGAGSVEIPFALIYYFNYNHTTQFLERDSYSADDWDEIIYHEVSNSRPVLYGGQSSGGGHEFVCDGYNVDDGTFHINWGWQGISNGYFVLSALDPDQQGIGGSSSTDGYNSDQDIVIGIQRPDETGNVSTAVNNATGISLQLLDISFSENPTIRHNEVTATITIKNNSINDYSSGIAIWEAKQTQGYLYGFSIHAGETKDYTYPVKLSPDSCTKYNVLYNPGGALNICGISKELVVYPQNIKKDMNAYGWATFSSDYPLDFSETGLEAYIVTGSNGNTILKSPINKVPANTGLVICGTANESFTIPVTLETTDDTSDNKLVAVPIQTTISKATDGNENFVLSVQSGKVVFARINNTAATVPAGNAYLTLPIEATAPWLAIDKEEDTTSLREEQKATNSVSIYYTLDGRREKNPTRGVYIVNGKKVFFK